MELALTFGAVGDFLALSVLIKDIIASLDDCRGSSKAYQDLVQSLVILDGTLCEVDQVFRDPRYAAIAQRLCATALESVKQIKDALQSVHDKLQKFRPSLGPGGSGNRLRDAAKKIQFKMDEKEISTAKSEIRAYTMALSILLQAMTLHTLEKNHDELSERLKAVATEAQSTRRELESTNRSLLTCFREIGHQVLGKIAFLTQTTLEIKTSAMQIASTVLTLSLELSNFRLLLLSLGRPPVEEYFTLEDALGRALPIHLRTITSWEALAFVLSERFKGQPGARRVQQGRYRLLEHATRREVARGGDWKRSFSRYQRIDMSLLCQDSESGAADITAAQTATCPWCKTDSPSDTSAQVQCQRCNMFFTRVVEIDDMILPPKPTHSRDAPRFGQPSFNVPIPPDMLKQGKRSAGHSYSSEARDSKRRRHETSESTRKRRIDSDDDYESDEADLHGLVRVTVVTRRKKIKVFHLPNSGPGRVPAPTAANGVINKFPIPSLAQKTHPSSSQHLQADKSDPNQGPTSPPSMLGFETAEGNDGTSLQVGGLGVNDYSFLPYQSLMAQRIGERSSYTTAAPRESLSVINTGTEHEGHKKADAIDREFDDENLEFKGSARLDHRYRNTTPFKRSSTENYRTIIMKGQDEGRKAVFLKILCWPLPVYPEPTEVRILRTINDQQPDGAHGCVQLVDFFMSEGIFPCIVMRDYLDSLAHMLFIMELPPPAMKEICGIAAQLFKTVAFLHDLNIVHGQIKLEHILFDDATNSQSPPYLNFRRSTPGPDPGRHSHTFHLPSNVHVRLCGFGAAEFAAPNTQYRYNPVTARSRRLRNSFSAPETIASQKRGLPADIWRLGCVLVEMFTGKAPFMFGGGCNIFDMLASMERVCGGTADFAFRQKDKMHDKVLERARRRVGRGVRTLEQIIPSGQGHFQDLFLDLVKRMLVLDPSKRITAKEALAHPWLQVLQASE